MPKSAAVATKSNVLELDLAGRGAPRKRTPAEAIRFIEQCIANPPPGSIPMEIEPEVATHVLAKYNIGNRTKKPSKIAEYKEAMLSSQWAQTRESLKFSDKGFLRDGQNRLEACRMAGVSFVTHVDFGVPDEAFLRMDQGKSRSGGDVLQAAGYKNTAHLPGAVRWVHLFRTDRVKQRDSFTPYETLTMLRERYPDLPGFMPAAHQIYKITGHPVGPVAALLHEFTRANPERAAEYIEAWKSGKDTNAFKPLGLVRKRVSRIKVDTQGTVRDVVRLALLVQAWNLWIQGRKGIEADIGWTVETPFPAILGA